VLVGVVVVVHVRVGFVGNVTHDRPVWPPRASKECWEAETDRVGAASDNNGGLGDRLLHIWLGGWWALCIDNREGGCGGGWWDVVLEWVVTVAVVCGKGVH
jgi:hypothetical protein